MTDELIKRLSRYAESLAPPMSKRYIGEAAALIEQQAAALEAANARIAELEAAWKGAPVAWIRGDDPREAISDMKKQDMIAHAGAPGRKLAECYSVPAFTAPAALSQPLEAQADARDALEGVAQFFEDSGDPEGAAMIRRYAALSQKAGEQR